MEPLSLPIAGMSRRRRSRGSRAGCCMRWRGRPMAARSPRPAWMVSSMCGKRPREWVCLGGVAMADSIVLRDVTDDDLPIFFEQQLDPDANYMAAFTSKDPTDRDAFMAHWARIRADKTIIN